MCVYTLAATDIVVDVNGYATAGSGPFPWCRGGCWRLVVGFRHVDGALQGIGSRGAGTVLTVPLLGRGGVPADGVPARC